MAADSQLRMDEPVDLTCPRCQRAAVVRFYGPCDDCRSELRASMGTERRSVAAPEYEPKINVTPNAVATKD